LFLQCFDTVGCTTGSASGGLQTALSHKDSFSLGEDLSQPGTRNCKQWLQFTAEPAGWPYIPNFKFLRGAGMEENENERGRKG